MYHNEHNFARPLEFHPERWLGDPVKYPEFANDQFESFMPFSTGHADCIGRNLAYSEMRLILAKILLNFDLTIAENSQGWIDGQKAFIVWQKPSLNVYLTPVKR